MDSSCFLGVDIGTYSSKGVLVDAAGRVLASHSLSHELQMPAPGCFEHDADQTWWRDFVEITRALLHSSQVDPRKIAAVGASGIGPCVLPVDEDGRPLRPGILYGIDTRAGYEIAALEAQLGREAIFQTSALHLDSQSAGPKILWIRNHEPEVFARARWFLTSQAYLVFRLTGQASIDIYTAGAYAPLFDVLQRAWNPHTAQAIVPPERLPRPFWTAEVVGGVSAAAAKETGLAEGTAVIAGTADAAAEALSTGMAREGDMLVMFGSSIFFILKTASLPRSQRFWGSNFLEAGSFALAGGMSTAGSLTTWFRDQLGQPETTAEAAGGRNAFAVLAEAAAASPLGARGLLALPYFAGERTPLHDPQACGLWFGLNLKHTRADLYRALLEGVAFGIRHNLEAMAEEGFEARRILVSGGGAHNRLWLQIVADVCGLDLVLPDQLAGACYGDAFLAALGAGHHRDYAQIEGWVHPAETIHCQAHSHAAYEPYYRIFRELYAQTREQMHRLAALTTGENKDE